jgi:hypothetical protein
MFALLIWGTGESKRVLRLELREVAKKAEYISISLKETSTGEHIVLELYTKND